LGHRRDGDIFTINATGGGRVQLTNNKLGDGEPSYSPNGKRIVYIGQSRVGGRKINLEVYTISADGGKRFKVTTNVPDAPACASYSLNAKRIVYAGKGGK
jgi:Tol biopolymer transport system component